MLIGGHQITHGLIIDEPWISKFLSGEKTWEMRSRHTKVRGRIALIRKGSGSIVGTAELYDSVEYSPIMLSTFVQHSIPTGQCELFHKWNVAWKMRNVAPLRPIPYVHKRGAVVWVRL